MATDPDARYASVGALAEDVERLVDGVAPKAEHASALRRAARWYVGRDPKMSRLRVMDVDLLVAGGFSAGIACAVLAKNWLPAWSAWVWTVLALVAGVPPMARWLGARRGE